MPIYQQVYRRHEARSHLTAVRFWPITREALRLLFARRIFVLLMAATIIPFVGFAIYIYALAQLPDMRRLAPLDGSVFARFLEWQARLALLPTIFAGSGLVANDLRTGAILLYLSRPITRRDYVLGKLLVPFGLDLSVTLLPGLALYAAALSMAPEVLMRWDRAFIAPAIALQSVLIALTLSLAVLAASSLSRSGRVAGIGFIALLFGLETTRGLLTLLTRRPEMRALSVLEDLSAVGRLLLGVREGGTVEPAYAVAVLCLAAGISLALLRWRVRAVEVVR